ncbi:MAG: hypothetical protein KDB14_03200, partial [Planctomycetales bacterium]|nr:hypothetical protein [Planctomycetales bacterium]
ARGHLPEQGTLEIWFDGDHPGSTHQLAMRVTNGRLSGRWEDVGRPLRYRVLAGDDRLAWRSLAVIEPPQLQEFSLQVTPPPYVPAPPYRVEASGDALVDSTVSVTATFTQSPHGIALVDGIGGRWSLIGSRADQDNKDNKDNKDTVEATVEFRLPEPLRLTELGRRQYRLEVEDQDLTSVTVESRVELEVFADSTPTVSLELPEDGHLATADSLLPLRGVVSDNAGIASIAVEREWDGVVHRASQGSPAMEARSVHRASQGSPAMEARPVHRASQGSPAMEARPAEISNSLLDETETSQFPDLSGRLTRSVPFDLRIPLRRWGVRAGDEFRLRVTAADFRPAVDGESRQGESSWRRVRIVSPEELLQHIGRQQAAVFEKFEQLLDLQRAVEARATEVRAEMEDPVTAKNREALQNVELQQRRIAEELGAGPGGAARGSLVQAIERALQEAALGGQGDEAQRRLGQLKQGIANAAAGPAQIIERQLVGAVRDAVVGSPNAATLAQLDEARHVQRQLTQSLEELLADAQQWTSYQQAAQELGRLVNQQLEIQADTEELNLAQLASDPAAPRGDNLPGLESELGRRFDKLISRLRSLLAELGPTDRQVVSRAVDAADTLRVSSDLRQCALQLERRQWGPAWETQEEVVAELRSLMALLVDQQGSSGDSDRPTSSSDDAGPQLLAKAVQDLLTRQTVLQGNCAMLQDNADPPLSECRSLGARQTQLADELTETAKQWPSDVLRAALLRSQAPMQRAAAALPGRELEPAAEAMRLARQRLEQLLAALASPTARSQPAEQPDDSSPSPSPAARDTARRQALLRLPELRMLATMQESLLSRTKELDRRKRDGTLTEGELQEQAALAEQQQQLAAWLEQMLASGAGELQPGSPGPAQPVPPVPPKQSDSSIDNLLKSLNTP